MKSELKEIKFEFDELNKELIIERDGFRFAIPKRYLFSLNRFLLRIFQKNFRPSKRRIIWEGTIGGDPNNPFPLKL